MAGSIAPFKRNIAIDFLKFFAVILVMNSHLDICFVKFSQLSSGGILGDALFFFVSGFGLFLGRTARFDEWYKRRICRIYPSVLAASIVALVLFGFHEDIADVLLCSRYWFIGCILLYYILLYPIKYFGNGKYMYHVFIMWLILCAIAYGFMSWGDKVFYGGGIGRILVFFLFMLQGAIMGKNQEKYSFCWWHIPACLTCLALWAYCSKAGLYNWLYFVSIFPFLGFTAFAYLSVTSNACKKFYDSRIGGNLIYIVGQLCLECYLIQKFCYSDVLNFMFPLNIPIFMLVALTVSYLVRVVAIIISQTFDSAPYDWKKLLIYKQK